MFLLLLACTADQDADGWGGGEPVLSCDALVGSAEQGGDCEDLDPLVNPGAQEVCDDADVDEDGDDAELGEECGGWDGVYTGTFEVNAVVSGIGITDTCSGTADIEVVDASAQGIWSWWASSRTPGKGSSPATR